MTKRNSMALLQNQCRFTLTRGLRVGQPCGKALRGKTNYCDLHETRGLIIEQKRDEEQKKRGVVDPVFVSFHGMSPEEYIRRQREEEFKQAHGGLTFDEYNANRRTRKVEEKTDLVQEADRIRKIEEETERERIQNDPDLQLKEMQKLTNAYCELLVNPDNAYAEKLAELGIKLENRIITLTNGKKYKIGLVEV